MTPVRQSGSSQPSLVLRGVLLQGQPHALLRPGGSAAESQPRMHEAETGLPSSECAESPSPAEAAYETGLAEGRKQGFAAAAALAVEETLARDAAVAELRVSAAAEGRLKGLAQGREEALVAASQAQAEAAQRAAEALAERLARVDRLLEGLLAEEARRLEEAEEDLVALSHETVCRILGAEAAQPERVRSMVLHLLAQHGERAQLAVHVHPDDFAALVQELDGREGSWRWVGDATVQLGGVVLRSPDGSLDARLETQMAALGEALLELRRGRREAAVHGAREFETASDAK